MAQPGAQAGQAVASGLSGNGHTAEEACGQPAGQTRPRAQCPARERFTRCRWAQEQGEEESCSLGSSREGGKQRMGDRRHPFPKAARSHR